MRRILVTSALPYANGPIHLGHMLEYIQTDIWVRFQKLMGNECTYVCADDAHGTAIMLRAEQEGRTPEEQIAMVKKEHERDFAGFLVNFDNYHSTHSPENHEQCLAIYQKLYARGYIQEKIIEQLYDPEKGMFLADRFVKGTCPRCKADDQYGDNCEKCGATYKPTELLNARSTLSGAKPEIRQTTQLFFDLPQFEHFLRTWLDSGRLSRESANKLREWVDAGLQPWDISREAPYFGFEIPTHPGKYFYVWLDAPIGYIGSHRHYCASAGCNADDVWRKDSEYELYHFIGKDIVNFHGLFWPAMLEGADLRLPTGIFTHGFVTVNGQKMSKSRGTFITAESYLRFLPPEALRYYFFAKLSPGVDDFDLNLDDFVLRINSDLVGKLVNIASRTANFIGKLNAHTLSDHCREPAMFTRFSKAGDEIREHYENREFGKACKLIMTLADEANVYIADKAPWTLAKDPATQKEAIEVCTLALNLFRQLVVYLQPVLPALAESVTDFLRLPTMRWDDCSQWLGAHEIAPFKPLFQRLESSDINAMIDDNKPPAVNRTPNMTGETQTHETISIDDFLKIDLRVGEIRDAQPVEGADKLLQLKVDIGSGVRTVFAGIKSAYRAEDLIGRHVVVVANLAPRKMKFGTSEGMVIAAGPGGENIFLLAPDAGAKPGMQVK